MRVKVVSDGMTSGTKVIDIETGKELDDVSMVTWSLRAGEVSRCTIELFNVPADVKADVNTEDMSRCVRCDVKGWRCILESTHKGKCEFPKANT